MQKGSAGEFHFEPPFTSFDHHVGELLKMQRHLDPERPSRLHIDDELELGRLQDRQIGGLRTLQDLTGVGTDLVIHVHAIAIVGHQSAGFDSLATGIAHGNPVMCRKRDKLEASAREEDITSDVQGVGAIAHESGEGRLDLAAGAGVEDLNLQSHCTGGFRYVSYALGTSDIGWIDQHGNSNGLGHQLVQKCQALCPQLGREKIDPGQVPPGRARLATRPSLTGSSPTPKTIGIVVVAALAASAAALPAGVAITATRRRARSAISAGRRSNWPSSHWYSTVTFWPST